MWPFNTSRQAQTVLRVGRLRVERWDTVDGFLQLTQQWPLAPDHDGTITHLDAPLRAALQSMGARPASLMLESAWAPVMALEVNMASAAHKAVRHQAALQINHLYGHLSSGGGWQTELLYSVGEPIAMAFGISDLLLSEIAAWADGASAKLTGIESAVGWWSERCAKRAGSPASWWLGIQEQDRCLLLRCKRRRVLGQHPGLPADLEAEAWTLAVKAEAFRQGLSKNPLDALWVGRWGKDGRSNMVDHALTFVGVTA